MEEHLLLDVSPEGKQHHTTSEFDGWCSVASASQAYTLGKLTYCDIIDKIIANYIFVKKNLSPCFLLKNR